MRPEAGAYHVLSTTRAMAKMHEFRVAEEDFISLPRDPAQLFGLAIGLLGDVAAAIAGSNAEQDGAIVPSGWGGDALSSDEALRFASIFFEAYLEARLETEITAEFSLMCAAAYYLGGSPGSAAVILRRSDPPTTSLANGLARIAYSLLRNDFVPIAGDYPHAQPGGALLSALAQFFRLEGGSEKVIASCDSLRAHCYQHGSARELLYADLIAAVSVRKVRNASRTVLPAASDLQLQSWRPSLVKPHFPLELWPAQQRIADAALLMGRSAVIQMPTSAGKTRATELVIRAAFLAKRTSLAIIVAPYRSLCHDIRSDLAGAFAGETVSLSEASDSFQLDLRVDELLAQDTILIVTPEKLLYMLRRVPELAKGVGLVIYDEGHQFEGITRGPTYELLLTSLRIALPKTAQAVFISAVIGNASDVAAWLIGDSDAVVDGAGLLPTARSIAFASWQDARGRLEYVSPEDPDEREFFVPRLLASTRLAARKGEKKARWFPEKDGGDVGLFLGLHLVANGSVALFCGRKDSVTKLCKRIVEIFSRNVPMQPPIALSDAGELEKLRALSSAHLGANAPATEAAALGALAHHADTPPGLRLSIEHAMKEGLTKFVICTSTLAQGVNFPLRYLIVTSTQQGQKGILVRDFQNLIGRAGRAGMHTEGSVIFSSPSVYDSKKSFSTRWRWAEAKRLIDPNNSEPCVSSLLSLFGDYEQTHPPIILGARTEWLDLAFADRDHIDAIVNALLAEQPNVSASEFRAFIEGRARAVQSIATFLVAHMTFEEADVEGRVKELASSTLAFHLADEETKDLLLEFFETIAASVVAHADADLRATIRRSPLAPAVVANLQTWLAENLDNLVQAAGEGRLLAVASETILGAATNNSIRSLSDMAVVPMALYAWAAGESYATIHAQLRQTGVRVSGDHITVDDVVALCENGFGFDVAMIVASLTDLTESLHAGLHEHLAFLQKRAKYGLPDPASIAFFEAGFSDRVVASALAGAWEGVFDRSTVRNICRTETEGVRRRLAPFPSYFLTVAHELAR